MTHAPAMCVLVMQWMWDRLQALQFLFDFLFLLAVNAQGGDGPSFQALLGNIFSALLTDAEGPIFKAFEGILYLLDEFSFAVPDPEGEISVRFQGSPVGGIWKIITLIGHTGHCPVGFGEQGIKSFGKELFKMGFLFLSQHFLIRYGMKKVQLPKKKVDVKRKQHHPEKQVIK